VNVGGGNSPAPAHGEGGGGGHSYAAPTASTAATRVSVGNGAFADSLRTEIDHNDARRGSSNTNPNSRSRSVSPGHAQRALLVELMVGAAQVTATPPTRTVVRLRMYMLVAVVTAFWAEIPRLVVLVE
jgi:hypothetical protein